MTPLEHFEKRVKQHTFQLDSRTKETALIWDLWCALREACAVMQGKSTNERTPVTGEIRGNLLYDGAVWVPIPHVSAPDEWFVWAIDRLRQDSKDGNFHRSYRFAQELITAISEHGYAIVPKERR